ncbi:MAG TPA: 2,4'-dihydroxyacetophenone dioxygenase family protein [Candidatus Acidoferrum sp.]|nr:2,4'-dihydroxyacetophenone dioxygenase family protein [Candidatus Acidoferrum sp.]
MLDLNKTEAPPSTKTATPFSTAYKIVDVPEAYSDVIKRHGIPGAFVSRSEEESPWVPFGPNAAIRHLVFDTRHNIYSNILWLKSAGVIGTHKHRGTVVMFCLEGSTRYLEYDWVAGPGDFIYETPGLIHTLVSDHPQGVKLFAWLQGPIEFYDDNGKFTETLDVFWFINHYETYCREQGIPINKQLYL